MGLGSAPEPGEPSEGEPERPWLSPATALPTASMLVPTDRTMLPVTRKTPPVPRVMTSPTPRAIPLVACRARSSSTQPLGVRRCGGGGGALFQRVAEPSSGLAQATARAASCSAARIERLRRCAGRSSVHVNKF
jgi:hypothetical protein